MLAALAVSTASALASVGHPVISQIKEAGAEPFSELTGVAINHATGDVFVVNGDAVDVFDSAGKFKTSFGQGVLTAGSVPSVAVDKTSGEVYVADDSADVIVVFKPNGSGGYALLSRWSGSNTPAGGFSEATSVAVNAASGLVYVTDLGAGIVDTFKVNPPGSEEALEGKYVSVLTGGKIEEPNGLAVNEATGQIYVVDAGAVKVFEAAGKFERKASVKSTPAKEGEFSAVGVDEATGDIYASGEGAVYQFDSSAAYLGTLTTSPPPGSPFGQAFGVALATGGKVYVADSGAGVLDVFGPGQAVPSVKTLPAPFAKITRTTATLKGTFEPEGASGTACHFEYDTEEAVETTGVYKEQAPCVISGTTAEAAVTGLSAQQTYVYRIVGENEAKLANYGLRVEFNTDEAVTGVTTEAPESLEPTSATLKGGFSPEGLPTKYHFEYGETTAYGTTVPVPDGETSEVAPVNVSEPIAGLRPNTIYHFRLLATNSFGTTASVDATFKTPGPPVITSEPTTAIEFTTATLNAKINPEQRATEYHFEYGPSTAYGTSVPIPDGTIAAGTLPVAVAAELTGLQLASTYHFRVVATNVAGTTEGPDQEFTTGPISSESAREVTADSAVLLAAINPFGHTTKYHFEYGKTTSYEAGAIPIPDATLEAGAGDRIASAHPVGLEAATTYHYRVVAVVEGIGTAVGADRSFRTLGAGEEAFKLPDGRGWEQVSPSNKHGGLVEPLTEAGGTIQASTDGSALAYVVDGPVVTEPEGNRSPEPQQVIATRGASSWESQEISTPHEVAHGLTVGNPPEYELFSSDLALAVLQPYPFGKTALAEPPLAPPLSEAERGHQEKSVYLRANPPRVPSASEQTIYDEAGANGKKLSEERGGAALPGYLPLVTAANVLPGTQFGGRTGYNGNPEFLPDLEFLGASADLTHVVLRSPQVALSGSLKARGLYEWAGNTLQLVSIFPNGQAAPEESPKSEPDLGYGFVRTGATTKHAVSEDGSRVIWTYNEASLGHGGGASGHLYLRDVGKGVTLQLDKTAEGVAEAEFGEARFQAASKDDTRIFFTDPAKLTPESSAATGKPDLYECEVVPVESTLGCNLSDLTVAKNESANVRFNVIGASETGNAIYFVATGVLAPGAVSGANNLYSMHEAGGKWTTALVARLSNEDQPDWYGLLQNDLGSLTARVSPSGQFLAFMSNQRLTGYDNTDVYEGEIEGSTHHADEEVFLYDANASHITCVSCNPTGARPRGVYDTVSAGEGQGLVVDRPQTWATGATGGVAHWLAGNIPTWTRETRLIAFYQSRYLNDEGRMFFNSADPLVAQATHTTRTETLNGKAVPVGVENVYEYEPNGVGNCTQASGCVGLLSSGESEHESAFLDASESGDDVFFLTASPLAPQDQDSSYDAYDAHVCSSALPCQEFTAGKTTTCEKTDECRPGYTPPSTFVAAPPPAPSGGNVTGKATTPPSKVTPPPAKLTNAQKLAKALKSCRKLPHKTKAQKKRRAGCEAHARKKYPVKKAKKARHGGTGR